MAAYDSLKSLVRQHIKTNGQNEITGQILQNVLIAMINSLGDNYQFAGVAIPSTNPGTPDQKVFYIASQAGTYTNFNGAVVSDGIAIFEWNGTWTTETLDMTQYRKVQSDWSETDTQSLSYIKNKPDIPEIANLENTDLDLSDKNGFSIARFKGGHIKTKNFDSSEAPVTEEIQNYDFAVSDNNENAIFCIEKGYPKSKNFNGERIVKSVENFRTIIDEVELYKTIVVNIADYNNNLVNVFNAISPTKDVHYTILIPEGTYNVNEWFTQSQIENSNVTHWRGLELLDYIKLQGVGCADKIILQWMNPDSATNWGYISTLNTNHWQELENLTVKANNIRYAVHDDVWDGKPRYVKVKNCNFIVSGQTSRAWGAGCNGDYNGTFENCKFILVDWPNYHYYQQSYYLEPFVLHDNLYNINGNSYLTFMNCRFVNPYTDIKMYFPTSWEQVTYNSSYPLYDEDKDNYAVNDCVNMAGDTSHSFKCLYAGAQVPPYAQGRPSINLGFGAEGATKPLYVTVDGCGMNTYISVSPKLTRVTGFGNKMGSSPKLYAESADSKEVIIDII